MTSRSSWIAPAAAACVLAAAASGSASTSPHRAQTGAETRSVRAGVYTAAQADRGAAVYKTRCEACHAPEQYASPAFRESWHGQTAEALFALIRSTMPKDNPGGLTRQQYADILAFIFRANAWPAGSTELRGTDEALRQVILTKETRP